MRAKRVAMQLHADGSAEEKPGGKENAEGTDKKDKGQAGKGETSQEPTPKPGGLQHQGTNGYV